MAHKERSPRRRAGRSGASMSVQLGGERSEDTLPILVDQARRRYRPEKKAPAGEKAAPGQGAIGGDLMNQSDHPENTPISVYSQGRTAQRLARRFGLSLTRAALVAELAGLGPRAA